MIILVLMVARIKKAIHTLQFTAEVTSENTRIDNNVEKVRYLHAR